MENASLPLVIQNLGSESSENFPSGNPDNFQNQCIGVTKSALGTEQTSGEKTITPSAQNIAVCINEIFEHDQVNTLKIEELVEKMKQHGIDWSEKPEALEELKRLKEKKPRTLKYLHIDEENGIARYEVVEDTDEAKYTRSQKYIPRNTKINAAISIVAIFEDDCIPSLTVGELIEKLRELGVDLPTTKYGDVGALKLLQEAKPRTLKCMRIDEEKGVVHYEMGEEEAAIIHDKVDDDAIITRIHKLAVTTGRKLENTPSQESESDWIIIDQAENNETAQSEKHNASE